jgi:hypothetical protein
MKIKFKKYWTNLNYSEVIANINNEISNKTGIYGLKCLKTGAIYIGSGKNIYIRFRSHMKGYKSNILLQLASLKTLE